MNTTPDIQREWLLSKWERFTDDELDLIADAARSLRPVTETTDDLGDEIHDEIARRQADVEADA